MTKGFVCPIEDGGKNSTSMNMSMSASSLRRGLSQKRGELTHGLRNECDHHGGLVMDVWMGSRT